MFDLRNALNNCIYLKKKRNMYAINLILICFFDILKCEPDLVNVCDVPVSYLDRQL